eukprot:2280565-Heterocapsa_arctica.AAC.1
MQSSRGDDDLQHRARKKDNILVKLNRLLPGAAVGLNAVVGEEGDIQADPEMMAGELRRHWAKGFAR